MAPLSPAFAGEQLDRVKHHEAEVDIDPESADQFTGGGLVLTRPPLRGAGSGQGAGQVHHRGAGHPGAVVANGQGSGAVVRIDLDVQIAGIDVEVFVSERFQAYLAQHQSRSIDSRKLGHVGIGRVDHQIQQLAGLRRNSNSSIYTVVQSSSSIDNAS
jgi:hypothetical protein